MGELNRALTLMGRDDAPRLFRELWDSGRITPAQLREHILDLWSAVEFPCRSLPRRVWMEWFEAVGFVSDAGRSAPTEDLEVWRAQTGRTLGLSWTTDPDKARWFHARNELVGLASTVLHGFAKPEGVLAFCDRRPEREVIVHPRRFSRHPTCARGSSRASAALPQTGSRRLGRTDSVGFRRRRDGPWLPGSLRKMTEALADRPRESGRNA